MEMIKLSAESRADVGTSAAKRLRRAGKIPAVLYGEGGSEAITLDDREFRHAVRGHSGTSVVELTVGGEKSVTAVVREVQRDPIRDGIRHVDLQKIGMKDKINARLPVRLVGESPGDKMGGVLQHTAWELEIKAVASAIPESIDVDISSLEIGDSIHVGDLVVPEGMEILTSPDSIIVSILTPSIQLEEVVEEEVVEEEGAEVEGAEEKPAEGEAPAEPGGE
jgi:large subunit ribosomal protein L25